MKNKDGNTELVIKKCIVCGKEIFWQKDDYPLPPACSDHKYEDVWEVFDAIC